MGLLTKDEVASYALRIGKVFSAVCDEENCGNLIKAGDLYVVLKWKKRPDGYTFLGRIPSRIRCMTCQLAKTPLRVDEVKVKGAGRGAKKLSREEASKLSINPIIRRAAISILKKYAPLPKAEMVMKLRKKKAVRELPKRDIAATIHGLKKLKLIKIKAKNYILPVEKVKKYGKRKLKKVLD